MPTLKTYTVCQHPRFLDRLQVMSGSFDFVQAEVSFICANGKVCVEDDPDGSVWQYNLAKAINMAQTPGSKSNRPAFSPFKVSVRE